MNREIAPLAIGIIDLGRMGSLYGQLCNEMALTRLVAICGEDGNATAEIAEVWGVPGYDGCRYRQLLCEHPEIEAVIVATPEWVHSEPVTAALEAGKHVLVEKPPAISPDEAWQMTACAEHFGLTLFVCHSLSFLSRFALM
jgi:predicted dehydrogenase